MCVCSLLPSLSGFFFAICLGPAVCQSHVGRELQGGAEGVLSLTQKLGPPSPIAFLPVPPVLGGKGGCSSDTLGSEDPRHIQCKGSKDGTTPSSTAHVKNKNKNQGPLVALLV